MKAERGSRGTVPLILNLSTRWRCVMNFNSLPLYPRGKTPDRYFFKNFTSTYNRIFNVFFQVYSILLLYVHA
jgi:hypothetical protein